MNSFRRKFVKSIAMCMQKEISIMSFLIVILFCLTVVSHAEEKIIPGDVRLEKGYAELSKKR